MADNSVIVTDPDDIRAMEKVVAKNAGDDPVISEAFIVSDDTVVDASATVKTQGSLLDITKLGGQRNQLGKSSRSTSVVAKLKDTLTHVKKSIIGESRQEHLQEGNREVTYEKIVEPPYAPERLAAYLQIDETHYRCVKVKVTDSIGRAWMINQKEEFLARYHEDGFPEDEKLAAMGEAATVRDFIENCNEIDGFEGVLEQAALDLEAVGYCAIEVIRARDKSIRKLVRVPIERVRVLRGWKGFIELWSETKYYVYQNFGEKVVSKRKDIRGRPEIYDPVLDGSVTGDGTSWNLVDRETNKPTNNLDRAANEILWIRKNHPATLYYGMSDVVPAAGHIENNIRIRDYLLQFFEHNTVPQYAVIIEGAKVADSVKQLIQKYFSQEIKGAAHKTLIIPIPSTGGEVKVKFEKLGADQREGSFQETRKNNQNNIMTAHGVSPAIIGIAEHSELGSGKGLSQAEIYKDRIVTPSQWRWSRILTRMFRLGLGVTRVELVFDPLDIRDFQSEALAHEKLVASGIETRNEARESMGIGDPTEGGDRLSISSAPQALTFVDEMVPGGMVEDMQEESNSDEAIPFGDFPIGDVEENN
jgi:capsid portal protein